MSRVFEVEVTLATEAGERVERFDGVAARNQWEALDYGRAVALTANPGARYLHGNARPVVRRSIH